MTEKFAESDIKQRHDYARHAFTATTGWFTFFVTVNYASMGWLAGSADKFSGNHSVIRLVAGLFITQNILGIIACVIMRRFFFHCNDRIRESLRALPEVEISGDECDLAGQTGLPIGLYSILMILMIVALIPVLIAWIMFHSFILRVAALI